MEKQRPKFRYDHLVKERYPQFGDALNDIDDALSMIHLYAMLPAETGPKHTPKRSQNCLRLAKEFQHLVIRRNALRKVFVSIKGYYFQCEVDGVTITWMVPHKFPTQPNGLEVDFRTLLTFLDFYETLLKFVNFKLYHGSELAYPPRIDITRDAAGAYLASLVIESESTRKEVELRAKLAADDKLKLEKVEKLEGDVAKKSGGSKKRKRPALETDKISKKRRTNKRTIPCRNFAETGKCEFGARGECVFVCGEPKSSAAGDEKPKDEKLPSLDDLVASIDDADEDEEWQPAARAANDAVAAAQAATGSSEASRGAAGSTNPSIDVSTDEFAHLKTEEERAAEAAQGYAPDLFKGLKFLLMRETPQEQLEFVIRCFSGEVVCATSLSSSDDVESETITHQIVDRPRVDTSIKSREYVQPQWVFDSINERCRLPVAPYGPGVKPPHHLSPFVDDERVGYIPAAVEQRRRWTHGDAEPVSQEHVEEESDDEYEDEEMEKQPEQTEQEVDSSDDMDDSDDESAPSDPSPKLSKRLEKAAAASRSSTSDSESSDEHDSPADTDRTTPLPSAKKSSHQASSSTTKEHKKKGSANDRALKKVDQHRHRDLEKIMMPKKSKRLYEKMMYGRNRRSDFNEKLLEKRRKLAKRSL